MKYLNCPIVEALLDIQVVPRDGKGLAQLDKVKTKLELNYPDSQVQHSFVANFSTSPNADPQVTQNSEPIGFVMRDDEKSKVVQTTLSSFSFSKLKPYQGWESFISNASECWQAYKEEYDPHSISRIALRYVDRVEVPLSSDLLEYFTTVPDIPDGLPQDLHELFTRVAFVDQSQQYTAVITQTIDRSGVTNTHFPFILDIDVFKNEEIDPAVDLGTLFQEMREFKNLVFEELITDKTRGLFN